MTPKQHEALVAAVCQSAHDGDWKAFHEFLLEQRRKPSLHYSIRQAIIQDLPLVAEKAFGKGLNESTDSL